MKFLHWTKLLVTSICILIVATSCFEEISYQTTYILKPLSQEKSADPNLTLGGVTGYAFLVDTMDWTVANYDDALAGILTSKGKSKNKFKQHLGTFEPHGIIDTIPDSKDWLKMQVDVPSVMILVVSPEQKLYGYRQQAMAENLDKMYVSIVFHPWKPTKFYLNGPWRMHNEFYVPAPDPEPEPEPEPDPVL